MHAFIYTCLIAFASLACNRKTPAANNANDNATSSGSNTVVHVAAVEKLPACVQHKIDSIKQLRVWNPPAEVHEYFYDGMKVFLFSADCCDMFPSALDENCNYICAPSGGFTGKGDGNCPDFNAKAKYVRLVWKDERKRGK